MNRLAGPGCILAAVVVAAVVAALVTSYFGALLIFSEGKRRASW